MDSFQDAGLAQGSPSLCRAHRAGLAHLTAKVTAQIKSGTQTGQLGINRRATASAQMSQAAWLQAGPAHTAWVLLAPFLGRLQAILGALQPLPQCPAPCPSPSERLQGGCLEGQGSLRVRSTEAGAVPPGFTFCPSLLSSCVALDPRLGLSVPVVRNTVRKTLPASWSDRFTSTSRL